MLDDILPRLEKVKKKGQEWVACCPVHNDRNPSMYLRETSDRVLIHCFSCGAKGLDVVKALDLPMSVLFKDIKRGSIPKQVIELAREDVFFIDLYDQKKARGERITVNELRRYRLAKERSKLLDDRQQKC